MPPDHLTVFYPHRLDFWGPINTMNREVAAHLPEGFRTVSTYADPDFPAEEYVDRAVRLNRIPWPYHARKAGNAVRLARCFAGRYDVVHTGYWEWDALARLTRRRGAAVVHTFHGPTTDTIERQAALAGAADVITAVSPVVKERVEVLLDLDTPVRVVPDGVNLERFRPERAPTEPKTVVTVARLIEDKHPELVVALADRLPAYEFVLVGPGPALDPPDRPNLTYHEELDRESVADLFARASLALHPFEAEGFSLVTLEAMAAGTPVVGLPDANLDRLLDDSNGVRCASLDPADWADALERAETGAFDPRATAREYAWSAVADAYADAYRDAVRYR